MTKIISPYIGITGFMTQSQVIATLADFPVSHRGVKHKLMAGVLASSKTLAGLSNKWPGRFPKAEMINSIFFKDPQALNLIHYSTDDATSGSFRNQLDHLVEIGGENLDGFQLNVVWPSPSAVESFRQAHPEKQLVLQVGHRAMKELSDDPRRIAEWIGRYVPFIEYVLIDPSGGLGKPFDPYSSIRILNAIADQHYPIGLGIAGGLGPNSMEHLKPIADIFSDISIDVEGKVRTPHPEDMLDMWAVSRFLRQSIQMLYPEVDLTP